MSLTDTLSYLLMSVILIDVSCIRNKAFAHPLKLYELSELHFVPEIFTYSINFRNLSSFIFIYLFFIPAQGHAY